MSKDVALNLAADDDLPRDQIGLNTAGFLNYDRVFALELSRDRTLDSDCPFGLNLPSYDGTWADDGDYFGLAKPAFAGLIKHAQFPIR